MQQSRANFHWINTMRLIVGLSGASGVIYGIRLLEVLQAESDVETHLVMSDSAKLNIAIETDKSVAAVRELADHVHSNKDIAATIASGSFQCDGMIIAPCSIKTLSAVANSYADSLMVLSIPRPSYRRSKRKAALQCHPFQTTRSKNLKCRGWQLLMTYSQPGRWNPNSVHRHRIDRLSC